MPRAQTLGNISVPPTPEDERHLLKLQAVVYLAKIVILSSTAFIGIWMVLSFIPIFWVGDFDKALKILPAIVPFWGTITGTVLGYLFGKNDP
jgi:hypothetical protein